MRPGHQTYGSDHQPARPMAWRGAACGFPLHCSSGPRDTVTHAAFLTAKKQDDEPPYLINELNGPRRMEVVWDELLNGPRRMEVVWDELAKRGIAHEDVEREMGLNVRRLGRDVIG